VRSVVAIEGCPLPSTTRAIATPMGSAQVLSHRSSALASRDAMVDLEWVIRPSRLTAHQAVLLLGKNLTS
jgi:hypothetical protein